MNLKELILFGMEESQEPVIKNPILQAALREPRPMAQGGRPGYQSGQLVDHGPGRLKLYKGGTSKWDVEELNKAAQHYEGKDYADLKTRKEKRLVATNLSRNEGKFKYPTTFEKLSPKDQAKLKAAYPEFADANFDKHKWGYDMYASKESKSKSSQIRYIAEELDFGGTKAGTLSPEKQDKVKRVFGDEWQGKWEFNKYKYGIPDTGKGGKNVLLGSRIRNLTLEKLSASQRFGFSRVDENYLLNRFVDASKDNSAYTLLKDSEGAIKGVNVNGQKYYHYKYPADKMQTGDKLITDHPSHNKVQKYLKFADEAKGNKSKFLNELFIKHNYKVPTVNQLIRHFWNKEGTTTTRNAIQKHHPGRVENIPDHLQLLDEWKNLDARKIHGKVDNNLISRADANIELKRKGIQIILDDGTKLGPPDINPEKQIRDYVKFTERKVKQVVKAGKLPELASALNLETVKPTALQELMKRTGAGIDPILMTKAVGQETGRLLKKPMAKTLSALKWIFETKSPAGGAFWAAEAPLLILQGAHGRYANERDFRKALKETGQFDDETINMLGETYGQELSDLGNVGLESWAVDQTDTSQFREKLENKGVDINNPNEMKNKGMPVEEFVKMGGDMVGGFREKEAIAEQIKQQEIEKRRKEAYETEIGRNSKRPIQFNKGGRVSFKFGGKGVDKGRRAFMKLLAALGIGTATAGTGLIKLGGKTVGKKVIAKSGVDIATSTPGMPSWFPALVNKIVKEGDDVTAKLATKERQVVHTKKIPGGDEATVYRDLDTGNVTVEYGGPLMNKKGQIIRASNDPDVIHLEYRAGEVIEEGAKKGKKTKPEFSAAEAEPEVVNWDGDIEMSGINEVNKVDDLVTPTNKLQEFATGKNLNIRDRLKLERQQKYKKKLETDKTTQIDYVESKRGPMPDPGDYGGGKDETIDVFAKYRGEKASGGRVSYFDGGIVSLKKKW